MEVQIKRTAKLFTHPFLLQLSIDHQWLLREKVIKQFSISLFEAVFGFAENVRSQPTIVQ